MRKSLNSIVCALVVVLIGTVSSFAADAAATEQAKSPAGVININTADASQLALLPRIGAKAATRIVEYRRTNGNFKKTTDLMQVKGVGDKTFELLAPYLTVDGKTTLTAKVSGPHKPRKAKQPATAAR